MKITCFIRYQIDPFQRGSKKGSGSFSACGAPLAENEPDPFFDGGDVLGYFLPHEGTNDVAWGLIAFDSLASYEAYRARLKADAAGKANFDVAQSKRFILREERTFLENVEK